MSSGWLLLIQSAIGGGVFTAVVQIVRAFLGRGKAHVDSAEVVQGLALQLVTPFAERLREADADLDKFRTRIREMEDKFHVKIRALEEQLNAVMNRARIAEDELRRRGIAVPGERQWTETNGGG
jgi:Mg2+ and Co2+ transporter CorA